MVKFHYNQEADAFPTIELVLDGGPELPRGSDGHDSFASTWRHTQNVSDDPFYCPLLQQIHHLPVITE